MKKNLENWDKSAPSGFLGGRWWWWWEGASSTNKDSINELSLSSDDSQSIKEPISGRSTRTADRFDGVAPRPTEFYRVLPSFTEFYRVWRGAGAAAGARAPTAAAATTTATASRRHCWPPTSPQPTPWSPRIRASTVKSGTQPDFLVLPNFT